MKRFDIIFSAVLIVVAVAIITSSASFPAAGNYDVGAGFFPKAVGVILIILSAWQIILSLRSKSEVTGKTNYKWVWISMGLLCLYILSINYLLGFTISTFVYLAVQLWIFKIRKPVTLALISLGVTGVIYYSFVVLLNVHLPDYF